MGERGYSCSTWIESAAPQSLIPLEKTRDRINAVVSIAELFDLKWRLPMVVYFAALIDKELVKVQDFKGSDDNLFT
jgi:hypothetical protein